MKDKGYIGISRKLFNNPFWNEAREFSRAEAWIDLIQSARFEAKQEIIQNKVIEVQRGELPASRRYLENRWGWGSTKVKNFLLTLTKLNMVTQRQTSGQTILKLVKYCDYNPKQPSNGVKTKPTATQQQPTGKPNIKKENKENNLKINKRVKPPLFDDFKIYALEKCEDVDLEKLWFKYNSWVENDWKTGKNTVIKNWKSTLLNTLPYLKKEKSSEKIEKPQTLEDKYKHLM